MSAIPLSRIDAAFLHMETPHAPMHVAGLMVFHLPRGAPRDFLRELFSHMRSGGVSTPPFNYRLAHGALSRLSPGWEPRQDIDIDDHLHHLVLPAPGDERALGRLIARLHREPLDRARALWQCHLIEGLERRRFALYLKMHHATMDGIGALKMVTRWLSQDPHAECAPAPWAMPQCARDKTPAHQHRDIWRHALDVARDHLHSGAELTKMLIHMSRRAENPGGGVYSVLEAPNTPFNAAVSAERRIATQLFELKRFRRLSDATGASINDLVLAVLGGALRRYLNEREALPAASLVASVPVGLPRSDGQPGNTVSGFICPLATHTGDPLQRLSQIHLVTQRTKEQLRSLPPTALQQLAMLGLSPMILGQLTGTTQYFPPFFNLVISNVPGPREKLYLSGAELEAIYPVSVLFDGHALIATVIGCADKLALGLTGCNEAVPHLQRIARYSADALEELERCAGIAKPRRTRSQRTARGAAAPAC